MKSYNQKFKIFGRKKGRKFLKRSTISILDDYVLDKNINTKNFKLILDIGSGDGENTIFLSKKFPDFLIIASDIYQNGNINLCRELKKRKIQNVRIFNKNILIFFEELKSKNLIHEMWILFPDPWPKTKHLKRRLIDFNFVNKISFFLMNKARVYIATDCLSYFISIIIHFHKSKKFNWVNDLPHEWNNDREIFQQTKYFKKALINNKKPLFLILEKI